MSDSSEYDRERNLESDSSFTISRIISSRVNDQLHSLICKNNYFYSTIISTGKKPYNGINYPLVAIWRNLSFTPVFIPIAV